jgi:hypothetical protein
LSSFRVIGDEIKNGGVNTVGYQFSLVLSREITDDESAILREANCASVVLASDSLPTDAAITVTKIDFDDTVSPSLAEAIESGLEAARKVPDLSVASLIVPAQPAVRAGDEESADAVAGTAEPADATASDQVDMVGAAFASD